MACADFDMKIDGADEESSRKDGGGQPMAQYYKATDLIPEDKGPLHDLIQKQPAVLGSLQMVSGFFSVGMGIFFAETQDIQVSLFTLFRLAHVTGILFFIAGVVSNLLKKYPALLPLSFQANCGCIAVAVVAFCLISVDLVHHHHDAYFGLEILTLCVLGLEVFLSAVLCFWFFKQKRTKSP